MNNLNNDGRCSFCGVFGALTLASHPITNAPAGLCDRCCTSVVADYNAMLEPVSDEELEEEERQFIDELLNSDDDDDDFIDDD